jgi:hypothetical protein
MGDPAASLDTRMHNISILKKDIQDSFYALGEKLQLYLI